MLNKGFITLVVFVLAAAAMRLVPHPPNLTPIAAMALFGGAHFASRRAGFLVPLLAMGLSDLVLGLVVYRYGLFHATMPFVYLAVLLTVGIGLLLRRRVSVLNVGLAALGSSVLFFVVTNFGVWISGTTYPLTPAGLAASYVAAIPFYRNTLAGAALYSLLLFGGLALLRRAWPALQDQPSMA